MNSKTAAKIANDKLKELGFNFTVPNTKLKDKAGVDVQTINVDISKLGVVSHMFRDMIIVIRVGYHSEDEFVTIHLSYKYHHKYGSNGYTSSFTFRNNKWVQID